MRTCYMGHEQWDSVTSKMMMNLYVSTWLAVECFHISFCSVCYSGVLVLGSSLLSVPHPYSAVVNDGVCGHIWCSFKLLCYSLAVCIYQIHGRWTTFGPTFSCIVHSRASIRTLLSNFFPSLLTTTYIMFMPMLMPLCPKSDSAMILYSTTTTTAYLPRLVMYTLSRIYIHSCFSPASEYSLHLPKPRHHDTTLLEQEALRPTLHTHRPPRGRP